MILDRAPEENNNNNCRVFKCHRLFQVLTAGRTVWLAAE